MDGKLLLSREDLKQLGIPFSRWQLRRLAKKKKGAFPKAVRLSHNVVAWRREEVLAWSRREAMTKKEALRLIARHGVTIQQVLAVMPNEKDKELPTLRGPRDTQECGQGRIELG